jgi:hypothetical protein
MRVLVKAGMLCSGYEGRRMCGTEDVRSEGVVTWLVSYSAGRAFLYLEADETEGDLAATRARVFTRECTCVRPMAEPADRVALSTWL